MCQILLRPYPLGGVHNAKPESLFGISLYVISSLVFIGYSSSNFAQLSREPVDYFSLSICDVTFGRCQLQKWKDKLRDRTRWNQDWKEVDYSKTSRYALIVFRR